MQEWLSVNLKKTCHPLKVSVSSKSQRLKIYFSKEGKSKNTAKIKPSFPILLHRPFEKKLCFCYILLWKVCHAKRLSSSKLNLIVGKYWSKLSPNIVYSSFRKKTNKVPFPIANIPFHMSWLISSKCTVIVVLRVWSFILF